MRHAVALTILAACAMTSVHAEGYGPSLTVLLDFQSAASLESVGELQREVQHLLKPSGLRLQLRLRSEVRDNDAFDDVVVVTFKGNCQFPSDPMLLDERGPGPLAFAHTAEGKIQPFSEVGCDSVRRIVESALWGDQRRNRDQLFGRALGRVVAHELVHMLTQTNTHAKTGLFKPSLSGTRLIAEHLELTPEDYARLRDSKPALH